MTSFPKPRSFGALAAVALATVASAQQILPDGSSTVSASLPANAWKHYVLDVKDADGFVSANLTPTSGEIDLYVRRGALPTVDLWDFRPYLAAQPEAVQVTNNTLPTLQTGKLYVSVRARTAGNFQLTVVKKRIASPRTGLGATPFALGSTFRVWAPFASSVNVAGSFNAWSTSAAPMVSEGNGNWSLDVRNARAGHEYKYVLKNGSQTLWKNDPRARALTNSVGNSIIVSPDYSWSTVPFSTPNWDKTVIYQMHIGAFNDAPGGKPGTFDSAIAKLDELKNLGVTTITLLPIHEFPGDFSWGYNPSHPFSVETAYGGPAKLKQFIDEAHKRGLGVMLDVVYNHLGPSDLDLWRFDGWSQNNRGGIYFYNDDRANTPWGDTRPDFGRGEVRQYLRDNALQWLEEYRADGLRFDSTLNIRRTNRGDNGDGWSLMQWINNEVDARQPWKLMLAEDLQGDSWLTRPSSTGGAGFDTQWSAQFVHPVRAELTKPWDADRNMNAIRNAVLESANGGGLRRTIYTESHDEVANGKQRLPSEIDPGNPGGYWARRRSTLGAALVMTSPGIPMIFMGQEFLEDGWFADTDPLDFSKSTKYAGIRQMYRDLIALRKNATKVSAGLTGDNVNFFHSNNVAKVVAFHRWKAGGPLDDVVVVMNFSNTTLDAYRIGLPAKGRWNVAFSSDWSGYSADFSNVFNPNFDAEPIAWDGLANSKGLKLAPYSTLILVRPENSKRDSEAKGRD